MSGGNASAQDTVVLHFKASVTQVQPGRFKASADDFPGLVAYGESSEEAQAGLEAAILKQLASSANVSLESVYEEARGLVPYAALSLPNRLLIATNLDLVLASEGGSREAWKRLPVTQQPSDVFQMFETEGGEDIFEPSEYSTQVYCLASFTPTGGALGAYAGTNLKGLVYVNEEGKKR